MLEVLSCEEKYGNNCKDCKKNNYCQLEKRKNNNKENCKYFDM